MGNVAKDSCGVHNGGVWDIMNRKGISRIG